LTPVRIELVVVELAKFHGVVTAFQLSHGRQLEEIFPLLNEDRGTSVIETVQGILKGEGSLYC
jgi:hypothetical protein